MVEKAFVLAYANTFFMMQAVSLLFPHEISDFETILCTESHKLRFQMYNFAVAMLSLQNYYIYM